MAKKGHHQGAVTWHLEVPEAQAWTRSHSWKQAVGCPSDGMRAGKALAQHALLGTQVLGEASLQASGRPGALASHPPPPLTFLPDPQSPGLEDALAAFPPSVSMCPFPRHVLLQSIPTCQTSWGPKGPGWGRQPATPTLGIPDQLPPCRPTVAPKTNADLRPAFSLQPETDARDPPSSHS